METNPIGLITAVSVFFGIWFGHVAVRKIEYISSTIWLPSLTFLSLGLAFEVGAAITQSFYLSAALGVVGITFLWDSFEFNRQQKRVVKGHAPANPNNPRHARILSQSNSATTIDVLNRNPTGEQLTSEEIEAIQEGLL